MSQPSTCRVVFQPNGITASAGPEETLAEVARRAAVHLFIGCAAGGCGVCRVQVEGPVSLGRVSSRMLSAQDRAAGIVLACRATARGALCVRREDGRPFDVVTTPRFWT